VCAGAGSQCSKTTDNDAGYQCNCAPTHTLAIDGRSCLAKCSYFEVEQNGVCVGKLASLLVDWNVC
jgi:hypothetical protein